MKKLKIFRMILAAVFIVGITLLFVGVGHGLWGWMPKLQFLPSVFRIVGGATVGNVAILAGILLLTLLFGRIYCSVICPLGVYQDVVISVRKLFKRRFRFTRELRWIRLGVLVAAIVSVFVTGQILISLIAPYSAYGRMVGTVVAAVSGSGVSMALLVTAVVTFVVITACSFLWGRAWCNTVCPVGTVLGYVSKASLFKIRIDESKCVSCGLCGRGCKASCIDTKKRSVDYSRCIDCFDCIDVCHSGAIHFGLPVRKDAGTPDSGRRKFLAATAVLAGSAALADAAPKQSPARQEPLVPFGAGSVKSFYDHCTSCQLCVSACPNGVLRPSKDMAHLLQPEMDYGNGYCRPECNVCSTVCPSGAIRPLQTGEKLTMKIGTAKVNPELCLAAKGLEGCGNCERHCPVGAIKMVRPEGSSFRRPVIMEDLCIGCGACEYLCPARPLSAITVEGIPVHREKQ